MPAPKRNRPPDHYATHYQKWAKVRTKARRRRGECVQCGEPCAINPSTKKPFWRCEPHRVAADASGRTSKKTRQDRWRAAGACIACGLPTGLILVGKNKGQHYARCLFHRRMNSASAAKQRDKRKILLTSTGLAS